MQLDNPAAHPHGVPSADIGDSDLDHPNVTSLRTKGGARSETTPHVYLNATLATHYPRDFEARLAERALATMLAYAATDRIRMITSGSCTGAAYCETTKRAGRHYKEKSSKLRALQREKQQAPSNHWQHIPATTGLSAPSHTPQHSTSHIAFAAIFSLNE